MIAEDVETRKSSSANVTIKLTDINDNGPVFESRSLNASVIETAPEGTVVITARVRLHLVVKFHLAPFTPKLNTPKILS